MLLHGSFQDKVLFHRSGDFLEYYNIFNAAQGLVLPSLQESMKIELSWKKNQARNEVEYISDQIFHGKSKEWQQNKNIVQSKDEVTGLERGCVHYS